MTTTQQAHQKVKLENGLDDRTVVLYRRPQPLDYLPNWHYIYGEDIETVRSIMPLTIERDHTGSSVGHLPTHQEERLATGLALVGCGIKVIDKTNLNQYVGLEQIA